MSWGSLGILLGDGFDISIEKMPENLFIFAQDLGQQILQGNLMRVMPHVKLQNSIQFVLNTLFPMINQNVFEPNTKMNGIMMEVLSNLQSWKCKYSKEISQFISELGNLQFVPSQAGKYGSMSRKCPRDLYDSSSCHVVHIFQDELVFPVAPFNSSDILPQLAQCGLMNAVSLPNLIAVVKAISVPPSNNPQDVTQMRYNRAKAILKYLPFLSSSDIAQFINSVKSFCWFPIQCEPTKLTQIQIKTSSVEEKSQDDYPICLSWKGKGFKCHFIGANNHAFFPSIELMEHCHIIGSQMYVVNCQLPSMVAHALNPLSCEVHVLAHLEHVIEKQDVMYHLSMNRIVQLIYQYLNDHITPAIVTSIGMFPPWIRLELERKFVSTKVVAMQKNKTFPYDLTPYIYTLSESFSSQFNILLTKCGFPMSVTPRQITAVLEMMNEGRCSEVGATNAWNMVLSILNWLTA